MQDMLTISRMKTLAAGIALLGGLAGCASAPEMPVAGSITPAAGEPAAPLFPETVYRQAQAAGKPVLRIDASHSVIEIEVRRDGALAGLGHDHLIASHDVYGYVLPKERIADLAIPVDKLTVDEPGLRQIAGFAPQPPADAIAATRKNMLEHVLEVAKYPLVLVHVKQLDDSTLDVALTIKGVTHSYKVKAELGNGEDGTAAGGSLQFKQSDFGITPFAALGGALKVQDQLTLRFRLWAK